MLAAQAGARVGLGMPADYSQLGRRASVVKNASLDEERPNVYCGGPGNSVHCLCVIEGCCCCCCCCGLLYHPFDHEVQILLVLVHDLLVLYHDQRRARVHDRTIAVVVLTVRRPLAD
jgi:hypothetical protein